MDIVYSVFMSPLEINEKMSVYKDILFRVDNLHMIILQVMLLSILTS